MMSLIRKINHMENVIPFFEDKMLFDFESMKQINDDLIKNLKIDDNFQTQISVCSSDSDEYYNMLEMKKKMGNKAYIEFNGKEITLDDCYPKTNENEVKNKPCTDNCNTTSKQETDDKKILECDKPLVAPLHVLYDINDNNEKDKTYGVILNSNNDDMQTLNLENSNTKIDYNETIDSMIEKIFNKLVKEGIIKDNEIDYNEISDKQKEELNNDFVVEFEDSEDNTQKEENEVITTSTSFSDAYLDSMEKYDTITKQEQNKEPEISDTTVCKVSLDDYYINHIEVEFENEIFKQSEVQSVWFDKCPSKLEISVFSNDFKYLKIKEATPIGNVIIRGYYLKDDIKILIDTLEYKDMVAMTMYHSNAFWSQQKETCAEDYDEKIVIKSSFTLITRKEYEENLNKQKHSDIIHNDVNCCCDNKK